MSYTVAQLIANTREMMDADNSSRWQDSFITTVLGIVHGREYSSVLGANPYYRFATRSVTTDSNGTVLYTALNGGTGDTAQTLYRILAIGDGFTVYRQTEFRSVPLATQTNYDSPYQKLWYDAGDRIQFLPVSGGLVLTATVSFTPPRPDQLSTSSVTVDFPEGHEVILWLEAAAMLLEKGAAESDAANRMRAMADVERQQMYQDITRRAARPTYFGYPDLAAEWGGMGMW